MWQTPSAYIYIYYYIIMLSLSRPWYTVNAFSETNRVC